MDGHYTHASYIFKINVIARIRHVDDMDLKYNFAKLVVVEIMRFGLVVMRNKFPFGRNSLI